ncbi:MAG: phytoene/squalene synthase family protein [Phycisphaerae bacterium]|nr:phytoene/squalene synthase family protein [Gemmatimonadaceae bacterium]
MPIMDRPMSDEAICARITRKHARTFTAASRFLPAEKRRAAFAVYAFCRVADDYVDEAANGQSDATVNLDRHRASFHAALKGHTSTPLFRELMWTMKRFEVPAAPFDALIQMLEQDLTPLQYDTWAELERYCGGVASTVGEMCAYVFGMPAAPHAQMEALRCARTLGVALQMTNILRDVGEDAGRGRCYLPGEELAQFSMQREEILRGTVSHQDERWRAFMQFQIARSRELYRMAEPGVRMLDRDAQCCATICATGYAGILGAIERRGYDSLGGRAHVSMTRKAAVMFSAWRNTRFAPTGRAGMVHRPPGEQPLRTGG